MVWVQFPRRDDVIFHFDDGDAGRHRHNRVEIALRQAELQVAEGVRLPGPDERVVGVQGVFQHIRPAVDLPVFFALGQFRAHTGRGVKGANAGGSSAHALGQGPLRHQFSVNLAVIVHAHKGRHLGGVGGGRKGTDHLFHLTSGHQGSHVHFRIHAAGVVGDAGQLFGALSVQGGQEVAC